MQQIGVGLAQKHGAPIDDLIDWHSMWSGSRLVGVVCHQHSPTLAGSGRAWHASSFSKQLDKNRRLGQQSLMMSTCVYWYWYLGLAQKVCPKGPRFWLLIPFTRIYTLTMFVLSSWWINFSTGAFEGLAAILVLKGVLKSYGKPCGTRAAPWGSDELTIVYMTWVPV